MEEWETAYLEALTNEYGIHTRACRAAGVHPDAVERRTRDSPRFAQLRRSADEMVASMWDYEAARRALEPFERPVFQGGKLVGVIREYDNKFLQWYLERKYPEKYHIPTRIEFGQGSADAINFRLSLGDSPPELPPGGEDEG